MPYPFSLRLAGGRAAGLLADDDDDGLSRFYRVEIDLQMEIAKIHFAWGIVLRVALDAEYLRRRIGAERTLFPEAQQEWRHHVEPHTPPEGVRIRLLAHETQAVAECRLHEVEQQPQDRKSVV